MENFEGGGRGGAWCHDLTFGSSSLWLLCGEYTAEAGVQAVKLGVLMVCTGVVAGEGIKGDQIWYTFWKQNAQNMLTELLRV